MFWLSRKTAGASFAFENVHIARGAEIGVGVEIGPHSFIGPNCRVGDRSRLHNNVTLAHDVHIGRENEIFPGAVLGASPQDKKHTGGESGVVLGDRNKIREGVTVHGGTELGGGMTRIGSDNLLMAGCHVAHDCIVEDHVTIANGVLLGGHVRVQSHAALGGLAACHHFVTVGQHAFVGGLSRVTQDVPPFMLAEGNPLRIRCVNTVGLQRSGFPPDTLRVLKKAHRLLFSRQGLRSEAMQRLLEVYPENWEIRRLAEFFANSEAGRYGRAREVLRKSGDDEATVG